MGSIGGGGGGSALGALLAVNNLSDLISDVTARANLGVDVAGTAATLATNAQNNAETFATTQANTAQSNAETFATTAANTAQSTAETYATNQASTAQTNAESFATTAATTAQTTAETYALNQAISAQTNAQNYALGSFIRPLGDSGVNVSPVQMIAYRVEDFAASGVNNGSVDAAPAYNAILTLAGTNPVIIDHGPGLFMVHSQVTNSTCPLVVLRGPGADNCMIIASPTISGAAVGTYAGSNTAIWQNKDQNKLITKGITFDGGCMAQVGTLGTAIAQASYSSPTATTSISIANFNAPQAAQMVGGSGNFNFTTGTATQTNTGANNGFPGVEPGMTVTDNLGVLPGGTTVSSVSGNAFTAGIGNQPPTTIVLSNSVANPTLVINGNNVTNCIISSGNNTATIPTGLSISSGQSVTNATWVPASTTVTSYNATTGALVISKSFTNVTLTFSNGNYIQGGRLILTNSQGQVWTVTLQPNPTYPGRPCVVGTAGSTTGTVTANITFAYCPYTMDTGTTVYAPISQGAQLTVYFTNGYKSPQSTTQGAILEGWESEDCVFQNINQAQQTTSTGQYLVYGFDYTKSYSVNRYTFTRCIFGPNSNANQDAIALNNNNAARFTDCTFTGLFRSINQTTFKNLFWENCEIEDPVHGANTSGNNPNRIACWGEFGTGDAKIQGMKYKDGNLTGMNIYVAAQTLLGTNLELPKMRIPLASIATNVGINGTGTGSYTLFTLGMAPTVPLSALSTVQFSQIGNSGNWNSVNAHPSYAIAQVISTTSFTVAINSSSYATPIVVTFSNSQTGPGNGTPAEAIFHANTTYLDLDISGSGNYAGTADVQGIFGGGIVSENGSGGRGFSSIIARGTFGCNYLPGTGMQSPMNVYNTSPGSVLLNGYYYLEGNNYLVTQASAVALSLIAMGTANTPGSSPAAVSQGSYTAGCVIVENLVIPSPGSGTNNYPSGTPVATANASTVNLSCTAGSNITQVTGSTVPTTINAPSTPTAGQMFELHNDCTSTTALPTITQSGAVTIDSYPALNTGDTLVMQYFPATTGTGATAAHWVVV